MIELRPYQREAHESYLEFLLSGGKRGVVQLPTGCGKTITGLTLAKRMKAKTLWIAHRTELITQPLKATHKLFPDVTTGIVKAKRNELNADFVFASVQSLYRRVDQLPKFDLVVVDECHHTANKTYRTVLNAVGDTPVLGLTATPERGDRAALDDDYEKIVYQLQLLQAIKDGYLVDMRSKHIELDIQFDNIKTTAGDLNQGELSTEMLRAGVPRGVADAYYQHARDKKGIIFTVSVDQAVKTTEALQSKGIHAEWISGKIKESEREAILQRLKTGETQVVVNCMVLTEGFDEPSVECVVVARPTKSKPLYLQMIGRGSRLAPGKKDCLILDVTGVSKRHSLVTVPVLFGTKGSESITEAEERQEEEMIFAKQKRDNELNQLQKIMESEEHKRFHQQIKWIEVNPSLYVIDAGDVGQMRIKANENDWDVLIKMRNQRAQKINNTPVWFKLAQGIAEDYIRRVNPNILRLIGKDAAWKQYPASERQLEILEEYCVQIPTNRTISKGEAAEVITKLFAK